MRAPEQKPRVNIDGNAFSILGRVIKALRDAGADKEYVDKYHDEATDGDYKHLLMITMNYVDSF